MAALEDWPVEDDFLLRESVEAGAALGAIARGILPFSKPYTREDITERWRCAARELFGKKRKQKKNPPKDDAPQAIRSLNFGRPQGMGGDGRGGGPSRPLTVP